MNTVLPDQYNLKVNGVFYKYTPIKNRSDDFKVTISNTDVFSHTDDWSGKSGGIEMRKMIGFEYIPRELWGDGSITLDGTGTIQNPSVVYTYRYEDGCTSPLDNPTCDGYTDAVMDLVPDTIITEIYNALDDDNVKQEESEVDYKEEEQESEEVKEEDDLERALAINEETLELGNSIAQNQMLDAMNSSIQMNTYYDKTIDGGQYNETVVLKDNDLPDNKQGRRMSLGIQILHDKMVNMQYKELK